MYRILVFVNSEDAARSSGARIPCSRPPSSHFLQDTSFVQAMPQDADAESEISLRPPPAPRSSVVSGASLLTPMVIPEETEEQLLERSSIEDRASSVVDRVSVASATPRAGGLGFGTPRTAQHRCISEIVLEDSVGLTQALVSVEGERMQLFSDQSSDFNGEVDTPGGSYTPGGSSGGEIPRLPTSAVRH